MGAIGSLTMLDYDRETSTMQFNTGNITALSLPGALTQFGALRDAVGDITNGTISAESLNVFNTRLSNTPPADENAQRERKWLVSYEDVTAFFDAPVNAIPNEAFGRRYTVEIPCADYEGRLLPNTDQADLANADIVAFVDAFEDLCKSPAGGAVNVLQLTAVGRRG